MVSLVPLREQPSESAFSGMIHTDGRYYIDVTACIFCLYILI